MHQAKGRKRTTSGLCPKTGGRRPKREQIQDQNQQSQMKWNRREGMMREEASSSVTI